MLERKIVAWTSSQNASSASGNKPNKKMKTIKTIKICCALIGVATLFATPNLFASITGSGTAKVSEDANDLIHVSVLSSSGANLGSAFSTFCLNPTAISHVGTTYNYDLSATVLPGGADIRLGTAWLYSQFRTGGLGGLLSTYGTAKLGDDALQAAIWWLQGLGGADNGVVAFAKTALSLVNDSDLQVNATDGEFGVVALNFYTVGQDGQKVYAQPLLGFVAPVPEPSTIVAGALLLLPFGVSTLRIMRKNKMQ